MRRLSHVRPDDDDESEREEEEDDEDEDRPTRSRRSRDPPRRGRRAPRRAPVRRWRGPSEVGGDAESAGDVELGAPERKTIYWRARDSLFFEPLVALAIIIVLLVSLFAYTQNWPPIYVVESKSMQHGASDQLGLINTGDMVLAQKVATSGITPYVTGLQTGYSTYGEYGDVLLYWPDGQGPTPIVHRAIVYLQWNPLGFYNATDLAGLPCGTQVNAVYSYVSQSGATPNCNTSRLTGTLLLHNIGWLGVNISVDMNAPGLGRQSGFLTMGDGNLVPDQLAPTPISTLVKPAWVIGAARGMIPWFGSVKLLLQGQANEVPPQSWEFMGLTLVGVILAAFGIHYALRVEGVETPLRKEEEDEARSMNESSRVESDLRRWFSHRRHGDDEEEGEEDDKEPPRRRRARPPPSHGPSHRGRPAPHVRRPIKPAKHRDSDDEL